MLKLTGISRTQVIYRISKIYIQLLVSTYIDVIGMTGDNMLFWRIDAVGGLGVFDKVLILHDAASHCVWAYLFVYLGIQGKTNYQLINISCWLVVYFMSSQDRTTFMFLPMFLRISYSIVVLPIESTSGQSHGAQPNPLNHH